jgi:hypothetical protein
MNVVSNLKEKLLQSGEPNDVKDARKLIDSTMAQLAKDHETL